MADPVENAKAIYHQLARAVLAFNRLESQLRGLLWQWQGRHPTSMQLIADMTIEDVASQLGAYRGTILSYNIEDEVAFVLNGNNIMRSHWKHYVLSPVHEMVSEDGQYYLSTNSLTSLSQNSSADQMVSVQHYMDFVEQANALAAYVGRLRELGEGPPEHLLKLASNAEEIRERHSTLPPRPVLPQRRAHPSRALN